LGNIPFLQPLAGIATFFTSPLQHIAFTVFHQDTDSIEISQLKKENALLLKKLIDQKRLLADDSALRDQFKSNHPTNATLIPAEVIGAPGFIPGISGPQSLILNVGAKQGAYVGEAVVVNNTIIGSIEKVGYTTSVLLSLQTSHRSFTAKTLETNAIGLVTVLDSGGLVFGNVLLSDTLKKDDYVVTKGDVDATKKGFPPDLFIGKIISIEKKPSDLFQTAKIVPQVDLSTVRMVFLVSY
jgi:rod shape-determining protein MreC